MQCVVSEGKAVWSGLKEALSPHCPCWAAEVHFQFTVVCLHALEPCSNLGLQSQLLGEVRQ